MGGKVEKVWGKTSRMLDVCRANCSDFRFAELCCRQSKTGFSLELLGAFEMGARHLQKKKNTNEKKETQSIQSCQYKK